MKKTLRREELSMDNQTIIKAQKEFYKTGKTNPYHFRMHMLLTLKNIIQKYQEDILNALYLDLGKSDIESYMTEVGVVLSEITHHIKHLKKWMRPKKVKSPFVLFKSKSYMVYEPLGTVLILAPWNYPFQLTMMPLIGAISSGNTSILKPSSQAKHTQAIIASIIKEAFDAHYIHVVLGDSKEANKLLEERFDHIFFTGSISVGKLVMEKASKHLTPVTLELGGKSPAIIDDSVSIKMAARRIVFGKFINAGQTCIAPDYLFIKDHLKMEFIKYFNEYVVKFYGQQPLESNHYPKIINEKQHTRLVAYLKDKNIVSGGLYNEEKITPTLLDDITFDSDIMQDEIFGPILPMISYHSLDEVIRHINDHEKPLALYLFTKDKQVKTKIINQVSFGGGCINDTLMHFVNHNLMFGGVGYSGMGGYHGYHTFLTLSNTKSILDKATWIDLNVRYHPFNEKKYDLLKKVLK